MHRSHHLRSAGSSVAPIMQLAELEKKYHRLSIEERARAMLRDTKAAIKAADEILQFLAETPKTRAVIVKLRKNTAIVHRMRPSEARNMLLDSHTDFIGVTRRKLQAWSKTMKRLAKGEGIIHEKEVEYIPRHLPVAHAYSCITTTSHYLAIVHVLLLELQKHDPKNAEQYRFGLERVRRCSTVLSDCEMASGISEQMH